MGKILSITKPVNELISRIWNKLFQLNKKTETLTEKWAKEANGEFTKEETGTWGMLKFMIIRKI